ncbi:MAG: hypothetical protein FGM43_04320 [Sinobacteraceae bacterium]|nr:hypothetical protein [Nevskiaceae bacterium]
MTTAIIGAGIGGLATALALRKAGVTAVVYEQASAVGEVGAGLSLTPNAVKALDWLGVGERIRALADEPPQMLTCHYASGETLVAFDRSDTVQRYGAPYLQMHRADLHRVLLDEWLKQSPDGLHTDRRLIALEANDSADATPRLVFEDATAHRHAVDATAVIAADGLKSLVRTQVFGATAPRFGGFVAWRGLVPLAALADVPLSAGSKVFAGPGRLFVRYPVRRGGLMNYVAFARVDEWQPEGWSQTGTVAEAAALLQGFHPEVHAILAATPEGRCHKWGLFAREPLPQWTRGRVALLGDAAHPMMPWFGQGAASALEDAVVLGRCVIASTTETHAQSLPTQLITAFRRYELTRHARVTLIHHESAAGGERLAGMQPERLRDQPVRNEDSLGLFSYDPVSEALA